MVFAVGDLGGGCRAHRDDIKERGSFITQYADPKLCGARLCTTYTDSLDDGKITEDASPDGGRLGNSVVTGKSALGCFIEEAVQTSKGNIRGFCKILRVDQPLQVSSQVTEKTQVVGIAQVEQA